MSILRALNSTFLTLIPKGKSTDSPDKFLPIAVCNAIYQITSKFLTYRLKSILSLLISHQQSSYVEGKQIMDSIILSHELIHSLKIQKNPGMVIELDMSKAFDNISWDYMRQVVAMFGFLKDSIKWIMAMVSRAFFYILMNGSPSTPFHPSRGILEGGIISPFLFFIMAKWLICLSIVAFHANNLSGLQYHASAPPSMHQQSADNTLLMGFATIREASSFKTIISDFYATLAPP